MRNDKQTTIENISKRTKNAILRFLFDEHGINLPELTEDEKRRGLSRMEKGRNSITEEDLKLVWRRQGRVRMIGKIGWIEISNALVSFPAVDVDPVREFIYKWDLNKTHLAHKIGINKITFIQKLNPDHYSKLTEEEFGKLKDLLKEMKSDLDLI